MATLTETRKCILLAAVLLVVAIVLHYSSVSYMKTTTNEKFTHLLSADSIFLSTSKIILASTTPNLTCLKNQYEASQKIKTYYLDVASTYYRNFYAFSICSILFGTVLAISTFLLIGTGWEGSKPLIRTFFLSSILITSFYFFLPTVLNNRENYAMNLKKVKKFNQIQMNILSFSTKPYLNKSDSLSNFLAKGYDEIANNFDLETVEIHAEQLGGNPQNLLKSANP